MLQDECRKWTNHEWIWNFFLSFSYKSYIYLLVLCIHKSISIGGQKDMYHMYSIVWIVILAHKPNFNVNIWHVKHCICQLKAWMNQLKLNIHEGKIAKWKLLFLDKMPPKKAVHQLCEWVKKDEKKLFLFKNNLVVIKVFDYFSRKRYI